MRTERVAFLGGGNMAEALAGGMLAGGIVPREHLRVADVSAERRARLADLFGVETDAENVRAAAGADVVVLAVKPQQAAEALRAAAEALTKEQLLISICAGLPTAVLEALVPCRVVRVMPNLPALVRRGVAAICKGARATNADLDLTENLFAAAGAVVRVPEVQMDEVTGLSGSGPGYVFAFIEALEAAGVEMGLPGDVARRMAVETVRGAAELAAVKEDPPAEWRRRVSSKGGTTLAGLAAMEAGGFSEAVKAGVKAARDRSAELAGG